MHPLTVVPKRAMFMTAGQLASYDQAKMLLLSTSLFKDGPVAHFTYAFSSTLGQKDPAGPFHHEEIYISWGLITGLRVELFFHRASTIAGLIAAIITSPMDVVKSRVMNAEKGFYKNSIDCTIQVLHRVAGWMPFLCEKLH